MNGPAWISAVNAIGTLLVAMAVAWLGFRQYRADQAYKSSQTQLLKQDLRVKLLEERSSVIEDFRTIYGHYFREAGLDDDGVRKMIHVAQRGALLFRRDLSDEIDRLSDLLFKHRVVSRRVSSLIDHDPREQYQSKLDEQFELEDQIWSSLKPLLNRMVQASRVDFD